MSNISRTTVTRQCYTLEAVDDDVDEEPERLSITGSAISSILEFHPNSAVVWIIDDESKMISIHTSFTVSSRRALYLHLECVLLYPRFGTTISCNWEF